MPAWMFLAKCVNLQDSIELAIWGNRIQEILLETRSTRNSCHFYFVQCYPARAFPYIDSQFAEQVLTFKQSLISFSFRLCVLLTVRYIQIDVKDIYDNLSQLLLRMLWSRNAIIRLWIPNSDLSKIRIQFYSQNVDQILHPSAFQPTSCLLLIVFVVYSFVVSKGLQFFHEPWTIAKHSLGKKMGFPFVIFCDILWSGFPAALTQRLCPSAALIKVTSADQTK